jgi:hypothetical protein
MALLTAAGLVRKRDDEGRKWIYYELTWTGQRILHPEATTTFNLLLGLSVAAAGGGVAMLGRAMGWWLDGQAGKASDSAPEGGEELRTFDDSSAPASGDSDSGASAASGSSAPQGEGAQNLAVEAPQDDAASGHDDGNLFFDDGGWIAIALLLTCTLFLVLAWFMQRKLVPKPLDETSAASAESGIGLP